MIILNEQCFRTNPDACLMNYKVQSNKSVYTRSRVYIVNKNNQQKTIQLIYLHIQNLSVDR